MAHGNTQADLGTSILRTIEKLQFIYDIQDHSQVWYANSVLLTTEDINAVSKEFGALIGSRFIELGLAIGASFTAETNASVDDTTIQLYKFNETLTRLLSSQAIQVLYKGYLSDADTASSVIASVDEEEHGYAEFDTTLLLKTLIKLLIIKLRKVIEMLQNHQASATETKIVDDILVKNISHKVLIPFHSLLMNRAQLHLSTLIS